MSSSPEMYESLDLDNEPLEYVAQWRCDNCRKHFEHTPIFGDNGEYCSQTCHDDGEADHDILINDDEDI